MNNIELERIVLAEFLSLFNGKEIRKYAVLLKQEYFSNPYIKEILLRINELIRDRKKPDIYYLKTLFNDESCAYAELEKISLIAVITTAGIESHIADLKSNYAGTRAIKILVNSKAELDSNQNSLLILNETIKGLKQIKEDTLDFDTLSTSKKIFNTMEEYRLIKEGSYKSVVPYCLPELDKRVFITKSQVHVLAGQSGMGKTGLALSLILKQIESGFKIIFFCCETRYQELINRMGCILSGARYGHIFHSFEGNPQLENKYIQALTWLNQVSKNLIIYGLNDYEHSTNGIEHKLLELTRNDEQFDMVYIDYLQSLKDRKGKEKHESIADDMREICKFAQEYNVAITLLSQFNRTRHNDEKADLHHLRGSSSIENYAHIVSFLDCVEKDFHPDLEVVNFELYSGKCRLQTPFKIKLERVSTGGFQEKLDRRYL